jgi:hypothetical protein
MHLDRVSQSGIASVTDVGLEILHNRMTCHLLLPEPIVTYKDEEIVDQVLHAFSRINEVQEEIERLNVEVNNSGARKTPNEARKITKRERLEKMLEKLQNAKKKFKLNEADWAWFGQKAEGIVAGEVERKWLRHAATLLEMRTEKKLERNRKREEGEQEKENEKEEWHEKADEEEDEEEEYKPAQKRMLPIFLQSITDEGLYLLSPFFLHDLLLLLLIYILMTPFLPSPYSRVPHYKPI